RNSLVRRGLPCICNNLQLRGTVAAGQNLVNLGEHRILNQVVGAVLALKHREALENHDGAVRSLEGQIASCRSHLRTAYSTFHRGGFLVFKSSSHSPWLGRYAVTTRTFTPSRSTANRAWNASPADLPSTR